MGIRAFVKFRVSFRLVRCFVSAGSQECVRLVRSVCFDQFSRSIRRYGVSFEVSMQIRACVKFCMKTGLRTLRKGFGVHFI